MTSKTEQLTQERGENYGPPIHHFSCTQDMFNRWVDRREVTEPNLDPKAEAALRHGVYMILDKLARMAENPEHRDNLDDIAGYAECIRMVLDDE